MQTLEGYQKYIDSTKIYLLKKLHTRMYYIEIKSRKIKELKSKSDYTHLKEIIKKQEKIVKEMKTKRKKLFKYAIKHVDNLEVHSIIKKRLLTKLYQLETMYTWTVSQTKFLEDQKKSLKLHYEANILRKNRFKFFLFKLFKNTLLNHISKEEAELYLTLKVYEHRNKHFFEYSNEMKSLEKFARVELYFLKIAIFFNALPIHGVGDLLSLPFWLCYAILSGYERTFHDYKDWKNTKHMSLKMLHLELEKIEKTL